MYKPIVTGLAILATAATLHTCNANADEPSPYAIKPGNGEKAVPTIVQRLMKQYCADHKDDSVCQKTRLNSFLGMTPEEALGMDSDK